MACPEECHDGVSVLEFLVGILSWGTNDKTCLRLILGDSRVAGVAVS